MKTITPDDARAALKKARDYGAGSGYNAGYLHGYADALREITGLQYCAVNTGTGCTWQWLTPEEIEEHRRAGYTVTE